MQRQSFPFLFCRVPLYIHSYRDHLPSKWIVGFHQRPYWISGRQLEESAAGAVDGKHTPRNRRIITAISPKFQLSRFIFEEKKTHPRSRRRISSFLFVICSFRKLHLLSSLVAIYQRERIERKAGEMKGFFF